MKKLLVALCASSALVAAPMVAMGQTLPSPAFNAPTFADQPTTRVHLGLGTAAIANTGTAAGNVPTLQTGGLLPGSTVPFGTTTGTVADGGALTTESTTARANEAANATSATSALTKAGSAVMRTQSAPVQTTPYPVNANWEFGKTYYQLQDATTGYAMWEPLNSDALPLDVIGLYVSAASVNAGGTGYAVGDTVTLSGGVLLTVSTVTSGAITGITVTTPNMFACAPGSLTAMPQLATSGSGTGATFGVTLLYPAAHSTHLLTKCYTGNALQIARSDTGETKNIGFLPNGLLDAGALDGFTQGPTPLLSYTSYNQGVSPRVLIEYDQGGSGLNATGALATAMTVSPGRYIGNSRTVMSDSVGQTQSPLWHPVNAFLSLPSGLVMNEQNMTVAVVAGTVTDNLHSPAYVQLGPLASGNYWGGIDVNVYGTAGLEFNNGAFNSTISPTDPSDASVLVGVSGSGGSVFDVDNTTITGSVGGAHNLAGGAIGAAANGKNTSGHVDIAADIEVPWAISASQRLMLEASLYHTFELQPQKVATVGFLGDSHMDDWGQPYQQTWARQMKALLNRPDVTYVNAGQGGAGIGTLTGSTLFASHIGNALTADTSGNRFVFIQGGYNDIEIGGASLATIEGSFTAGIAEIHADNAKAICVLDIIRNAASGTNATIAALSTWEANTTLSGCDYVMNFQAAPVFDSAAGPWPAPWFQSDGKHLTPAGASLAAEMAATFLKSILPAPQ